MVLAAACELCLFRYGLVTVLNSGVDHGYLQEIILKQGYFIMISLPCLRIIILNIEVCMDKDVDFLHPNTK